MHLPPRLTKDRLGEDELAAQTVGAGKHSHAHTHLSGRVRTWAVVSSHSSGSGWKGLGSDRKQRGLDPQPVPEPRMKPC